MFRVFQPPRIALPDGKRFAFSVFDDTDESTIENTPPVYDFLQECGFRTTKSVWPIAGSDTPLIVGGATCEDAAYLRWLKTIQAAGFEIAYHNATFHSSDRQQTIRAIERFADLFGHYPISMANHTTCREAIYWGSNRVSGVWRKLYRLLAREPSKGWFRGHVEGDRYFWGDICRRHIRYVRNYVFREINLLRVCPYLPYHDSTRPYVNFWFPSAEGPNVDRFNATLSEDNQDRLEEEGGICIMYGHLAVGFYKRGRLDQRFQHLMRRLSAKEGWFVPVSTLLDHVLQTGGPHVISPRERFRLESSWMLHKLRVGTT